MATAAAYSRYGNPWPGRFAAIREALAEIGETVVLDGEIVAIDAHASFRRLVGKE